jgi:hypothetical protein
MWGWVGAAVWYRLRAGLVRARGYRADRNVATLQELVAVVDQ